MTLFELDNGRTVALEHVRCVSDVRPYYATYDLMMKEPGFWHFDVFIADRDAPTQVGNEDKNKLEDGRQRLLIAWRAIVKAEKTMHTPHETWFLITAERERCIARLKESAADYADWALAVDLIKKAEANIRKGVE